jgi:hypothetical protein
MTENQIPAPPTFRLGSAPGVHLERVNAGQGRFSPQADGEQKVACDMDEELWGCPCGNTVTWPDGNPLTLATLNSDEREAT